MENSRLGPSRDHRVHRSKRFRRAWISDDAKPAPAARIHVRVRRYLYARRSAYSGHVFSVRRVSFSASPSFYIKFSLLTLKPAAGVQLRG